MTWNYRVIRHLPVKTGFHEKAGIEPEPYLAIHEVHYDDDGKPDSYSQEPCTFSADEDEGKEGIIASLERAIKTIKETPILNPDLTEYKPE